jgi:hypothetical protein
VIRALAADHDLGAPSRPGRGIVGQVIAVEVVGVVMRW